MITHCECCNIVLNVHISQNYSASTSFHEENFVRDFNPEGKNICFKVATGKWRECEINNNNNKYNNYIIQKMHLMKYNSWQVLNSYMFQHWGAILRKFF
jgi:hypothetical protein